MPSPHHAERIETIASEVLAYLRAHPEACDTARGVCQWWIPRVRLHEAQADVEAALELLLERGRIRLQTGADGIRIYCASREPQSQPDR